MYKKLNTVQKYLLKLKDKEKYRDYKFLKNLQTLTHPSFDLPEKDAYSFKHSGNIGDIIYALPAIQTLAKGKQIHIYLHIDQKGDYGKNHHPLGEVMLNKKMFLMMQPLLLAQPSVISCEVYNDQPVDFDMDIFRNYPFKLQAGNIARWYFLVFGINADLGKTWLKALPDNTFSNAILIARSSRYHAPGIKYDFLSAYPRVAFVGLKDEFDEMKKMIPDLEYQPVNDFLELANIIAGCKFFIGNQSFPFSLAEALKVKRMLEVYHQSANVNVEGVSGYDFCYQPQFEKLAAQIYAEKMQQQTL